jgi:hypothetical protein
MKKLIFLTIGLGIVLGIIIGANVVTRCASAQSNFPMCVTVYKYLIWKDFKEGAIPIGSSNANELQASGFEVKNNALKFPVVSNAPECSENLNGMIYYDSKRFKCCVWDPKWSKYNWLDCGGGEPPSRDTVPFTIYDQAHQKTVLEIDEK